MIELMRSDRYGLDLRFDSAGAQVLVGSFQAALNGSPAEVAARIFPGVLPKRRRTHNPVDGTIRLFISSDADTLVRTKSGADLTIDRISAEYVIQTIQHWQSDGKSVSHEFFELMVGGRDTMIYGHFEVESDPTNIDASQ